MREEEVMVVRDLDQLLDLRLSKLDQRGGTGAFIKVLLILFGSLRNETVCSVMFGFESF